MTRIPNRILAGALLAGSAIAAIAGTALAHSSNGADVGCEILASPMGGGFGIEAVYHASDAVQGIYRLSVESAGANRTSINQGGAFSARPGETLTLGRVNVGGAPAYDVTLSIEIDGQPIECGGRVSA